MKNFILLFFTFLSFNSIHSQNTSCATADPVCSGNIAPRPSGTNSPSYGAIGCCFTTPNAAWFTFQVGFSGNINFFLHQGNNPPFYDNRDVDFVCWGPFSDESNCTDLFDFPDGNTNGGVNNIVACSYSGSPTENFVIPNANPNEYYVLLITNFSNVPGFFVLEQTNGGLPGAGSTNCDVVCGVKLGSTALTTFPDPPAINTISVCDSAISSYNLHCNFENPPANQATLAYQWYRNGILQPTLTTKSITVTQSGIWRVVVTHPDCGIPSEDSVNINFGSTPVLTAPPTQFGPLGDCNPTFDLTALIPAMLAPLNPADFSVYFFTDQNDALTFNIAGSIPNPSAFQPNPAVDTIIYVRARNTISTECEDQDEISFLLDIQCTNNATAVGNTVCVGNFGELAFSGPPNAVVDFNDGTNFYNVPLNGSGTATWTTPLAFMTAGTYNYTITNVAAGSPVVNTPLNNIATITVVDNNTVSAASYSPILCVNTAISPAVTHATTGATGIGTPVNLPAGVTVSWSANTITIVGTPSVSGVFNYSIPLTGGCGVFSATGTITVTAEPTAAITYASPFCSNDATVQTVTFSGTGGAFAGGVFSSALGLTIDATTGAITPSTSTAGVYTVTYTIPASGGCAAIPVTTSVTITALPAATISYAGTPFCTNNATPQTVTFTGTTGGTYSSTAGLTIDATTGAITPSTSTAGTYLVTYTMAAANGCSLQTATTNVTITTAPTAVITYASPFCSNDATVQAVTFSGTGGAFAGGVFSSALGLTIDATTGAITPSTSTAGVYTVTYTIPASGGCAAIPVTTSVTITALPAATISYAGTPFCTNNATPQPVTFTGTTGGTYSSTAGLTIDATTGAITPSTSTAGTYLVTYTMAAANGCPLQTATTNVTITTAPTAVITYASPFCSNDATVQTVTFSGTGGAFAGGVFSSALGLTIDATTGAITPSTSTAGVYTVTYTIPASGGCAAIPVTTSVTITALPAATISYVGTPFCTNNATPQPVTFTGTTGGTYSSTAGLTIDATTGAITPSTSTAGTYLVTYTMAAANGCPLQTATTNVTITTAPTAVITYASPFCSNDATVQTVTFSGTGGAFAGGVFSSALGLTIDATTGAITPSTSTAGVYTVTYTIPASGGCAAIPVTTSVTITALPAATISYAGTPFCTNNATPQPVTFTGTTGGTYSSTAGLTIDATTGAITPSTSTAGTYLVTYTMAAANGCPLQTATTNVTITTAPTAVITYASPFCSNDATVQTVTFSGTGGAFAGGVFSSALGLTIDATTGAITPSTSTAGVYTVTYTIPASGGCAAIPVTTSVTITALPAATISYAGTPFCTNNATPQPVTFTGTTGGTYSSTAGLTIDATTGAITPSTSTAGTYLVTYTMAAANGCPLQTATTNVTITTAPTAVITYASPFCSNDATVQTVTFSGTGGAFAGGVFSSALGLTIDATTGAITPSTSTAGVYTVTYTIPASGGCAAIPVTTSVTITALPAATISYAGTPFCTNNATPQPVTFTGTTGGTYSSTAGLTIDATTGAITPSTSTAGTYLVTYTMAAANGCPLQTATTNVTITTAPTAVITYASPFCSNDATVQTVTFSGTGGAFAGGVFSSALGLTIDATTGAITPSTSTAGVYTVTYTIPASGGCAAIPVTTSVTISPIPTGITITTSPSPAIICVGGSANLEVTATPGTVITWSGTPSSFTIGSTGMNVIPVSPTATTTYTLTSASLNGCTIPVLGQSTTVTVSPTPQFITQVPDITICNGGTLNIASQLTSTVPGTTFVWSATSSNVNTAAISGNQGNIDQIVNLINSLQEGSFNIEVTPQVGTCSGTSQQILVNVKTIPVIPVNNGVSADRTVICNNESVTITLNSSPAATLYNWQVNAANTNGVQIVGGATSGTSTNGVITLQLSLTNPLAWGEISFNFTPENATCPGDMVVNAIKIRVNPIPGTPIGLPVSEICSGESTNLTISSFPIVTGTDLVWTVIDSQNVTGFTNGTGPSPFVINDLLINTSNVQGFVKYSVTSKLGNCNGGTTEYIVEVNPLPKPNLINGHICVNEDTGITYQGYVLDAQLSDPDFTYDWYILNPTTNTFEALLSGNQSTYEATVAGTYQLIVTNTVTNCAAPAVQATVGTIYPAQAFTSVVTDAFTNDATITVTVNPVGTGNLIYSLDGGAWQSSNVFTGVEAGLHQVMVEDVEGCTNLTQSVMVIDYPKFFTPNGDGYNDNWNIVGLNQADAKLYIFDRYGKLIKQLSATDKSSGWDGTYNGQQAPSSDYWFSLDYIENNQQKQFKAHFSLKR